MTSTELHKNIKNFCVKNADEEIVKKYSRYFKGGFNGYGLHKDLIPNKVKEYKNETWCTIELVYEVSKLLIPEEKFELPSFSINLLNEFAKEYNYKTFKEIESWFSIGINNWAHIDGLVQYFFPVFWKKEIIKLEELSEWRKAENKFQRRCVPVAMIKLLKHDTDLSKMFGFIDSMMMDSEREVHQGLGWFLRECWKKDRKLTEEFLLKWKNDCARLIIQYATEKMTKEERLQFRRDKK
ncbi:MAG: DNA alkylation repair protein [Bacteroidales bacterium]|nr:DNA alkylation repair protein [Bacteroidales bacterium]